MTRKKRLSLGEPKWFDTPEWRAHLRSLHPDDPMWQAIHAEPIDDGWWVDYQGRIVAVWAILIFVYLFGRLWWASTHYHDWTGFISSWF